MLLVTSFLAAQKPHSSFRQSIQSHDGAVVDFRYAAHVLLPPKWMVSILLTGGAREAAKKKTDDKVTRQMMIPIHEISISLLLPYLSTKNIAIMEPTAFRPEVTRESAIAVSLEANPAN